MAKTKTIRTEDLIQELVAQNKVHIKDLMQNTLEQVLEAEITETIGAKPYERGGARSGYRVGYYNRAFITRVGRLGLRVPRDPRGAILIGAFRVLSALRTGFSREPS